MSPFRSTCARTGRRRCEKRVSTRRAYRLVGRGIAALFTRRRAGSLFERIQELSAPGAVASRWRHSTPSSSIRNALTSAGPGCSGCAKWTARAGHEMADAEELWFPEERADVADWLGEHGWQVTATEARELMTRYHREATDESKRRRRQAFRRRTARRLGRASIGELELDHRGDGVDGLAERRQPCRHGRCGQHSVSVGLSYRNAGCQRVQPHCGITATRRHLPRCLVR